MNQALRFFAPIIFLLAIFKLPAQDEGLRNYDYTYLDNIRSVKFHSEGLLLSYPIIELGGAARLALSFDDIDGDVKDYIYTFVHCDINWQPSNLQEMEYLEGFTGERIQQFSFSFKTLWPYTHYELSLPNNDLRWLQSGNYLLKVYDDTDERRLAITRRFVVVEPLLGIGPQVLRASQVSKFRTHQEIDFVVDHPRLKIQNPLQEIRAVILQNGRWDNAVTDVPPKFIRPNSLIFDYQDRVVFPGGKEFRFADLRSLRLVSFNVLSVDRTDDGIFIQLKKDQFRAQQSYTTFEDINGNFVLETTDQDDNDLAGEYCEVFFTLNAEQPYSGKEVYLFGAFTEWQLKPEYRMAYNESRNGYVGKALLKQGYYDYSYAVLDEEANNSQNKQPVPDMGVVEGNSFETENEYTILIYYRPFGSRFDRVVGAATFTSEL